VLFPVWAAHSAVIKGSAAKSKRFVEFLVYHTDEKTGRARIQDWEDYATAAFSTRHAQRVRVK